MNFLFPFPALTLASTITSLSHWPTTGLYCHIVALLPQQEWVLPSVVSVSSAVAVATSSA